MGQRVYKYSKFNLKIDEVKTSYKKHNSYIYKTRS